MSGIDWREWTPKTLRLARKRGQPIFLFLTASWSSRCREMEETTLSDAGVADMIGESFIAVRVDADRRPDIFQRFTMGGWPSLVFLDPTCGFITGTTFTTPERMLALLCAVVHLDNRPAQDGASAVAPGTEETGVPKLTVADEPTMPINDDPIDFFFALAKKHYDHRNGGFGGAPKFLMAPACRLLMARAFRGDRIAGEMLEHTLKSMSEGAIHGPDGEFRRYASRRDWSDPCDEVLLCEQADMALLYLDAFSLTREPEFERTAIRILDFIEEAFGREDGVFAGSLRVGATEMQDDTVFAGPIARTCSAFIKAEALLDREGAGDLAVDVIDFLLDRMINDDNLFNHYVDDHGPGGPVALTDQTDILAMLLDAFESSGNSAFVSLATTLARATMKLLFDKNSGTCLDTQPPDALKTLSWIPARSIANNARLAIAFIRLSGITGDDEYRIVAESCAGAFASNFRHFGLLAADYDLAIAWINEPILEIFFSAKDRGTLKSAGLRDCARANFHPRKIILMNGSRRIKSPPAKIAKTPRPMALVRFGCGDPISVDNEDDLIERFNQAV